MASRKVFQAFAVPARCLNKHIRTVVTSSANQTRLGVPSTGIHKPAYAPLEINNRPRIQDMRQGDKLSATFSEAEFEERLRKLRAQMREHGMQAAVFTSYHNINYYSGFIYCSFGRPYGLVVTLDTTTLFSAGIDGGQPWRRSLGTANNVTYTDWQKDNFYYAVSQELQDIKGTKIGLEFDHVSLENASKFQNVLSSNTLVDISRLAMRMRMIKSEEEIAVIKNGARVADIGGAAGVAAIKEGVPEYEVALSATQAMVRAIANTYPNVELLDTWTWFQSGANTDGAHNPVTDKPVQKGDILSLNCFPMISGYYTALERTLFLGHVSEAHLRNWEVNCEVHHRGLELIRPGARCSDIARELNAIYKDHDLLQYRSFGYGHSFGCLSHYYGREADLELREDIDTILMPNMVVSMEPMIMIPEGLPGAGGYREHDILVVTSDGAINITGFPFGPEHNVIKA